MIHFFLNSRSIQLKTPNFCRSSSPAEVPLWKVIKTPAGFSGKIVYYEQDKGTDSFAFKENAQLIISRELMVAGIINFISFAM